MKRPAYRPVGDIPAASGAGFGAGPCAKAATETAAMAAMIAAIVVFRIAVSSSVSLPRAPPESPYRTNGAAAAKVPYGPIVRDAWPQPPISLRKTENSVLCSAP